MSARMQISDVRLRLPNRPGKGVVAWVSCVVSGIKLDSIVVRRAETGALVLGFPGRHSRSGGKHFYFEPVDRETRRAIEEAILGKLPGFQSGTGEGMGKRPGDSVQDERRSKP